MFLVGAFDDRNTAATVAMIDPDFTSTQRALGRKMFSCRNILAVGGPVRIVQQAKVFLGQLSCIATVGLHDPDVVSAAGVARKRNLGTIR